MVQHIISRIAVWLLAIVMIVFGLQHFRHPKEMINFVPPYLPGGVNWVYFVGVAFMLAAVSFITNRFVAVAGYLLAGMLLAFLIRPVSLTEICTFVLEEGDNKSAWYNHSTDYTDDSPTEQRSLPAFTALDGFRLFDVEAVHPRWDLQG